MKAKGRSVWAIVAMLVCTGLVVGVIVANRSGDATSRREQLLDAYATGLAGTNVSDEDARCLAGAQIEAVGVAELAAAGSPEELRANPPVVPAELDLAVSDQEGEAYYDALGDCTDPRRRVTAPMSDADARCFDQRIDDELLHELIVARFTSAREISPTLEAALTDVAEHCPSQPAGARRPRQLRRLAGVRSVQPGAPSITVITYNVRGLLRAVDKGVVGNALGYFVDSDMTRFTRQTGDEVAAVRADFVLLQEICGSQAELIAQRSSQMGHAMSVIAATPFSSDQSRYQDARRLCPGEHPPDGQPVPYGRALLAHLPNAVPIEAPPGEDAQCIRAESPRPMRVCNVHTELPRAASVPGSFRQWAKDKPLILGGDFNMTPESEPISRLFDYMYEADAQGRPTDPAGPAPADKKIDYIWFDRAHFGGAQGPAEVLPMPCIGARYCSDHQLLEVSGFTLLPEPTPAGLPPQIDPSDAGGTASAVYLAVTESYDDPRIARAETAARSVGYEATSGDLACDVGAAAALGRDPASFAAAVAVYFDTGENAQAASDELERRGIPVTGIAVDVSLVCLEAGG